MSLYLYILYNSVLSEKDRKISDLEVFANRKRIHTTIENFILNAKTKSILIILGATFYCTSIKPCQAMGVSVSPMTGIKSNYKNEIRIAPVNNLKSNKISFIRPEELPMCFYMTQDRFSYQSTPIKLIKITKIRGGGFIELIASIVFIILTWKILKLNNGVNSFTTNNSELSKKIFQPPNVNFNYPPASNLSPRKKFGSSSLRPQTNLRIDRPSDIPHENFVEMTKEERRLLPSPKDMKIFYEDMELEIGFYQSKYKVAKHGAIHGLPFDIKPNGSTKTLRSEQNALKMMQSIVNLSKKDGVKWIENTFQADTDREFDAIHLYDPETDIIVVFKKSTRQFVTTC